MKTTSFRKQVTLALGLAVTLSPIVSGIMLDRLLYRNFVKEADLIVRGTVIDESFRSAPQEGSEGSSVPHTFTTIAVEETFKGEAETPENLVLRTEGGLAGDGESLMVRSGTPLWDIGDEGYFFINRDATTGLAAPDPLIGLTQGFTRSIQDGGGIMNEMGYELLRTGEPLFAARIHPRDILIFPALIERLNFPQNAAESAIANALQAETRQLLEEPDSIEELPREAFTFTMPETIAAPVRDALADSENTLPELLGVMMRANYRAQLPKMHHLFLYRDLNHMLFRRDLFDQENLAEIELREVTQQLLEEDVAQMPVERVLLRNRRVMEDIFPRLLVKSLDENIVPGPYQPVPAMMNARFGDKMLRMEMPETQDGEGEAPDADPLPEGEILGPDAFDRHLREMIDTLHTQEELDNLQPVASYDPGEDFSIPPAIALEPPRDFRLPGEPNDPIEPEEAAALEEAGGNPVLPEPEN